MIVPAFISVRSTSSRLPRKCFLPLGDTDVLGHMVARVRHYGLDPIVCTTVEAADNCVVEAAQALDAKVYRGEPVNRLKRWADCCAAFGLTAFHTVDADDPFFDGDEVRRSFELLHSGGWDMVAAKPSSSAGGASVGFSITRDIAERAVANSTPEDDTEIMWYWIDKVPGAKKTVLTESKPDPVTVRLTLDYAEDYWLIASVVRMVGPLATRGDVDDLFRRNPDLYKINWFRNQEWAAGQAAKKV